MHIPRQSHKMWYSIINIKHSHITHMKLNISHKLKIISPEFLIENFRKVAFTFSIRKCPHKLTILIKIKLKSIKNNYGFLVH